MTRGFPKSSRHIAVTQALSGFCSRTLFGLIVAIIAMSTPMRGFGSGAGAQTIREFEQPDVKITPLCAAPSFASSQSAIKADDDELREIEDFDDDLDCEQRSNYAPTENGNCLSKLHWFGGFRIAVVPFRLSAFPGRAPPLA